MCARRRVKFALVLYGEWLKAADFPIGAAAYLTTSTASGSDFRDGFGFARRRVERCDLLRRILRSRRGGLKPTLWIHASAIAAIEIFSPGIFTGSFAP
jgi:hypothetical protein